MGEVRSKRVYMMLRLTSDDLDPEEVTTSLALAPTRAFRRGDPFQAGGRTHPRAYGAWMLSTESAEASEELIDHCRRLLTWIEPARLQLEAYLGSVGVRVTVAVWWQPTDGPIGFTLPSEEVRLLAGICHEFDFYFE